VNLIGFFLGFLTFKKNLRERERGREGERIMRRGIISFW
jgi:hypothetical protein